MSFAINKRPWSWCDADVSTKGNGDRLASFSGALVEATLAEPVDEALVERSAFVRLDFSSVGDVGIDGALISDIGVAEVGTLSGSGLLLVGLEVGSVGESLHLTHAIVTMDIGNAHDSAISLDTVFFSNIDVNGSDGSEISLSGCYVTSVEVNAGGADVTLLNSDYVRIDIGGTSVSSTVTVAGGKGIEVYGGTAGDTFRFNGSEDVFLDPGAGADTCYFEEAGKENYSFVALEDDGSADTLVFKGGDHIVFIEVSEDALSSPDMVYFGDEDNIEENVIEALGLTGVNDWGHFIDDASDTLISVYLVEPGEIPYNELGF